MIRQRKPSWTFQKHFPKSNVSKNKRERRGRKYPKKSSLNIVLQNTKGQPPSDFFHHTNGIRSNVKARKRKKKKHNNPWDIVSFDFNSSMFAIRVSSKR